MHYYEASLFWKLIEQLQLHRLWPKAVVPFVGSGVLVENNWRAPEAEPFAWVEVVGESVLFEFQAFLFLYPAPLGFSITTACTGYVVRVQSRMLNGVTVRMLILSRTHCLAHSLIESCISNKSLHR